MNMKQSLGLSVVVFGLTTFAHANEGYLVDRTGQEIRDSRGECWRSGTWSAGKAVDNCEGKTPTIRRPDTVSNFDFNKSDLKPEAQAELSKTADMKLKAKSVREVSVVGYADSIGTPEANEKISSERAENTKNYLVSRGVPASKIRAEGRGAEKSVTGQRCEGLREDQRVACLKDDRRVEVQAR